MQALNFILLHIQTGLNIPLDVNVFLNAWISVMMNMEIKSAKGFWAFIVGFMAAGSAWLAVAYRTIERIVKRR